MILSPSWVSEYQNIDGKWRGFRREASEGFVSCLAPSLFFTTELKNREGIKTQLIGTRLMETRLNPLIDAAVSFESI